MEASEGDIELAACIVYYNLENGRFSLLKLSQSYKVELSQSYSVPKLQTIWRAKPMPLTKKRLTW